MQCQDERPSGRALWRMKHLAKGLALAAMATVAVAQEPFTDKQQSGLIEPNAPIEQPLGSPLTLLGQRLFYDRGFRELAGQPARLVTSRTMPSPNRGR